MLGNHTHSWGFYLASPAQDRLSFQHQAKILVLFINYKASPKFTLLICLFGPSNDMCKRLNDSWHIYQEINIVRRVKARTWGCGSSHILYTRYYLSRCGGAGSGGSPKFESAMLREPMWYLVIKRVSSMQEHYTIHQHSAPILKFSKGRD